MKPTVPAHFSPGRDHLPRLDAIRGIAILMVVFFHAFMFGPQSFGQEVFEDFIAAFSQGVPIFFILSGFLISLIVFENPPKFNPISYAQRRIAKILPPFALSLAFLAVKDYRHGSWMEGVRLFFGGLATLPNFMEHWALLNPVAWSLLVEIHFYLILPLIFFGWRIINPRLAERLTIACFFLIPPIFRVASWMVSAHSVDERSFLLCRFPCVMDFFAWGMLFCHLYRHHSTSKWLNEKSVCILRCGLLLFPLFLLIYAIMPLIFHINFITEKPIPFESTRLLICIIGFCMLFCIWPSNLLKTFPVKIFGNRFLQYTGLISYEWFLFHLNIITSVKFRLAKLFSIGQDVLSPNGSITFGSIFSYTLLALGTVAFSYLICAAIYHLFSQPLLKAIRNLPFGKK